MRQRAPQRDRDRVNDLVARGVVGARQHGGDRADEREQHHRLGLVAYDRLDLLVEVVDHALDEGGVRHRFHARTPSRTIRPQLIPV